MGKYLARRQVGSHAPTAGDWSLLEHTYKELESFEVVSIADLNDHRSRIFFALGDGTQNDLRKPERRTNVAALWYELLKNQVAHVGFDYISGVGTYDEENPDLVTRLYTKLDAALSLTHRQRAEKLYQALSDQVCAWKQDDPEANVSVVQVGFSRGCGVAALFNQMIHDRGIQDEKIVNGKLKSVDIIKPGELPQATLLYDPVTTFMDEDLCLSTSTVSALQINAAHEYRALFPLTSIASGANQLQVPLPGAHSDIGGGYAKDGLARYARDLGHRYLNRLLGQPVVKSPKLPQPGDASLAIHHSWEHSVAYRRVGEREVVPASPQQPGQCRVQQQKEIDAKKAAVRSAFIELSVNTTPEDFAKVTAELRDLGVSADDIKQGMEELKNSKAVADRGYER